MPEPDCFLRYRISAATRNFTSAENPIGGAPLQRAVVLKWFYSLSHRKTFVGDTCSTECPSSYLSNQAVRRTVYLNFCSGRKGKGKCLDTSYSATYMSQTRDQQRFTISEVVADWHEPTVPQRIMWPSIARTNEQLDPRCS